MAASLDTIRSLLSPGEVFERGTPQYKEQSQPWSTHADKHPLLVVTPSGRASMSKIVKALYDSDLDFAVRNTGTGSVSAEDVILSTHGFKSFSFDKATETIEIGAGLDWGEVDALMEEQAPGFAVVGARCPWVGVAGSTLVGGLSWLSHEFGLTSDPQNLLDVQVVLSSGRVLWASEEPDLLWALRGGGGNFGVVTALKMQARPYPTKIFSGVIAVPYTALQQISVGVATMAKSNTDPRVAMHILNLGPGMGMPYKGSKPDVGFFLYDANGEAHARSDAALKWIFDLPGAQEFGTGEITLRQIHANAETFRDYQGTAHFWLSAPLMKTLEDETLVRAWKWYEDAVEECPGLGENSTVLLEYMQEPAFNSTTSRTATAFPHSGRRHVMQLVLGCKQESAPSDLHDIVMRRMKSAGREIAGPENDLGEFHAGFLHEWNHLQQVYGENYEKLRGVKARYDPRNRFNKGVDLVAGKVEEGTTV